MSLISVKNLSIGYGNKIIKKSLSFSVEKGEYVCIVGSNGCGKSTLMKTMLGIIPKKSGEIVFDKCIDKSNMSYLTQNIIMIKDFPATVNEVVMSGYIKSSIFPNNITKLQKEKVKNVMGKMGIENLQNKSFNELSGGQKQRVLLSRALLNIKDILFLDEPVTGLDANITKELYDIVEKLNKEDKLTIVMISHDMEMVKKYATKVVKLDE